MRIVAFDNAARRHVVAVFGSGLIGGAILNGLCKGRRCTLTNDLPFSWNDSGAHAEELKSIAAHIAEMAITDHKSTRVDMIWAAGRGGFSGPKETFDAEAQAFARVLDAFSDLSEASPHAFRFHLFSSAGGLFEGRRVVSAGMSPTPLRPYGFAKLHQEELLTAYDNAFAKVIYRPSSVYGYNRPGDRIGLVTALLNAAYHRRPALIFGRPASLRDFIFNEDIARFVVSVILGRQSDDCALYHLVSGQPSSIDRIIREAEKATRLSAPRSYVLGADNTSDNTFHPSIMPKELAITPLQTGIGMGARRLHRVSIQSPRATAI